MASAMTTPMIDATTPIANMRAMGCGGSPAGWPGSVSGGAGGVPSVLTARDPNPPGGGNARSLHEDWGNTFPSLSQAVAAVPASCGIDPGALKLDGGAPWWRRKVLANCAGWR